MPPRLARRALPHKTMACTYARVYHRAFQAGAAGVDRWVRTALRAPRSHGARLRWTTHILTLACTQDLGRRIAPETLRRVHAHHRLAHLGWVLLRLVPLQRRVLRHLWRPGGALMRRACAAAGCA